jgi:hypothetical protein
MGLFKFAQVAASKNTNTSTDGGKWFISAFQEPVKANTQGHPVFTFGSFQ